jgi:hypothetical protein
MPFVIPGTRREKMRSFLINKNLCFYYKLRKRIGKKKALLIANVIERGILIFGREAILSGICVGVWGARRRRPHFGGDPGE